MPTEPACQHCGAPIEVLRRPLRRLRWSRHWWRGLASFAGQPLKLCPTCGAIHRFDGTLIAHGAAETGWELRVRSYRDDMIGLRDGFGVVVLASAGTVGWALLGPVAYAAAVPVAVGTVGAVAMVPFVYFARKVGQAKKEMKNMKSARKRGEIVG